MRSRRVFLSYSRMDGKSLANHIRTELENKHGIPIWQDVVDMEGGKDWWRQITTAIDQAEYLLLALTPGAVASSVIQDEWRYARQQGVCVVPVVGAQTIPIHSLPAWMRRAHFVDLRLSEQWASLVRTLITPCQIARVPLMAERPPNGVVLRKQELRAIREALVSSQCIENIHRVVVLKGAGGFGKTTLAQTICWDDAVQETFYDGVLWITLSESPGDLAAKLEDLIFILSGAPSQQSAVEGRKARLTQLLKDRAVLVVVDDVWNLAHTEPFIVGGDRCAHIVTTRNTAIALPGATDISVDSMLPEEAVWVLSDGLPTDRADAFPQLATRLGHWPLLLKLVNSSLRDRITRLHDNVEHSLAHVNQILDTQGLTGFDTRHAVLRSQAVAKTLSVSLDQLTDKERQRFFELAVFANQTDLPISGIKTLWSETNDLNDLTSDQLLDRLHSLSLLQHLHLTTGVARLHDIIAAYLRHESANHLVALHMALLNGYGAKCPDGWKSGPNDGYFLENLAYHLRQAGRTTELVSLLVDDPGWRDTKRRSLGTDASYFADLDLAFAAFDGASAITGFSLATKIAVMQHLLRLQTDVLSEQRIGALIALDRTVEALRLALLPNEPSRTTFNLLTIATHTTTSSRLRQIAIASAETCLPMVNSPQRRLFLRCEIAKLHAEHGDQHLARDILAKSEEEALSIRSKLDDSGETIGESVAATIDELPSRYHEALHRFDLPGGSLVYLASTLFAIGEDESASHILSKISPLVLSAADLENPFRRTIGVRLPEFVPHDLLLQIEAFLNVVAELQSLSRSDEAKAFFGEAKRLAATLDGTDESDTALSYLADAVASGWNDDELNAGIIRRIREITKQPEAKGAALSVDNASRFVRFLASRRRFRLAVEISSVIFFLEPSFLADTAATLFTAGGRKYARVALDRSVHMAVRDPNKIDPYGLRKIAITAARCECWDVFAKTVGLGAADDHCKSEVVAPLFEGGHLDRALDLIGTIADPDIRLWLSFDGISTLLKHDHVESARRLLELTWPTLLATTNSTSPRPKDIVEMLVLLNEWDRARDYCVSRKFTAEYAACTDILVAGFARSGLREEAERLIEGLLEHRYESFVELGGYDLLMTLAIELVECGMARSAVDVARIAFERYNEHDSITIALRLADKCKSMARGWAANVIIGLVRHVCTMATTRLHDILSHLLWQMEVVRSAMGRHASSRLIMNLIMRICGSQPSESSVLAVVAPAYAAVGRTKEAVDILNRIKHEDERNRAAVAVAHQLLKVSRLEDVSTVSAMIRSSERVEIISKHAARLCEMSDINGALVLCESFPNAYDRDRVRHEMVSSFLSRQNIRRAVALIATFEKPLSRDASCQKIIEVCVVAQRLRIASILAFKIQDDEKRLDAYRGIFTALHDRGRRLEASVMLERLLGDARKISDECVRVRSLARVAAVLLDSEQAAIGHGIVDEAFGIAVRMKGIDRERALVDLLVPLQLSGREEMARWVAGELRANSRVIGQWLGGMGSVYLDVAINELIAARMFSEAESMAETLVDNLPRMRAWESIAVARARSGDDDGAEAALGRIRGGDNDKARLSVADIQVEAGRIVRALATLKPVTAAQLIHKLIEWRREFDRTRDGLWEATFFDVSRMLSTSNRSWRPIQVAIESSGAGPVERHESRQQS